MVYYILCVLIAMALPPLSVGVWTLARRDLRRDYEGPAKLELFGRQTHTGWVRQGSERIEILTIEGEALQIDTRARYKLQVLTWQALCDHAARECEARERGREEARKGEFSQKELVAYAARCADFEERHGRLKEAIEKAFTDLDDPEKADHSCGRAEIKRELQEAFDADDPIPF